jgi:hypothetical protein
MGTSNYMIRKIIAYFTMLLVLLQANTLTVAVVLGMTSVAYPTISYSQENSDTPLLDKLKQKYDLNNPRRQYNESDEPCF